MTTATLSPASSPIIIPDQRNMYQALAWPTIPPETRSRHGKHVGELLKFVQSFESFAGGDDWEAANVALYSVSLRHEVLLYQYRRSWPSKYGIQVRKQYFLVRWVKDADNHAVEEEIPSARARAAVRAFPDDPAGAVEYLLGMREKPKPQPKGPLPALHGFKLVRYVTDATGTTRFYSFYDGKTEYEIGRTIKETAQADHQAGLYMYLSQEMCEPSEIASIVGDSDEFDGVAILRVVGEGKRLRYSAKNEKYAVSRLTPICVVRFL